MYMLLNFYEQKTESNVSFSELVNNREIFIIGNGNVSLQESQMRELRKWLTIQIRKTNKK